jgi:phage portal protein BeeE
MTSFLDSSQIPDAKLLPVLDQFAEQQGDNRSNVINDILAAVLTSSSSPEINQVIKAKNIKLAEALRRGIEMYVFLNKSPDVAKYARRSRRTPEEFAQYLVEREILERKMYEGQIN